MCVRSEISCETIVSKLSAETKLKETIQEKLKKSKKQVR